MLIILACRLILSFSSAASASTWTAGDLTTYGQGLWDADTAAVVILCNGFLIAYPSSIVEIGIPGTAGFSMRFTDPSYIRDYLPAGGLPAALTIDLINPTSSSSGVPGGDILALKFNVNFSDDNLMPATISFHFGDLFVYGLTDVPAVNGMTVRQILGLANTELGSGTPTISYSDLDMVVTYLNASF